jgi:hypothetical protein
VRRYVFLVSIQFPHSDEITTDRAKLSGPMWVVLQIAAVWRWVRLDGGDSGSHP